MITDFTKDYLAELYPSLPMEIGDWSYGRPRLLCDPGDVGRKLTIGRYCSIAENVRIFVGGFGRHATEFASTYPIGMLFSEHNGYRPHRAHAGNLDVEIGSDVWIGRDALIMAGVTIGHGAVIGSCALVTRDVAPYAIVGGVPAALIRKRFDDASIARLLATRWWELEPDDLQKIQPLFYNEDMIAFTNAVARMRGLNEPSAPKPRRRTSYRNLAGDFAGSLEQLRRRELAARANTP